MVIVGGSYKPGFLGAEAIPTEEQVIIFDTDASSWKPVNPKDQQVQPAPWNLIFCSLVKLDYQNLAVLWNDYGQMRISMLNIYKPVWRHVRVCSPSEDLTFRHGHALLPKYS